MSYSHFIHVLVAKWLSVEQLIVQYGQVAFVNHVLYSSHFKLDLMHSTLCGCLVLTLMIGF